MAGKRCVRRRVSVVFPVEERPERRSVRMRGGGEVDMVDWVEVG